MTDDLHEQARGIVLRQLAMTNRSRQQLRTRLLSREIPEQVADQVLDRFADIGLIDDEAFAASWVRGRHTQRGLSRSALTRELSGKGISAELAENAVAEIDDEAEYAAAEQLAIKKLRSMENLDPAKRVNRLVAMLARRGYNGELALRVTRAVVAEQAAERELVESTLGQDLG
jgi:regulatory protein